MGPYGRDLGFVRAVQMLHEQWEIAANTVFHVVEKGENNMKNRKKTLKMEITENRKSLKIWKRHGILEKITENH